MHFPLPQRFSNYVALKRFFEAITEHLHHPILGPGYTAEVQQWLLSSQVTDEMSCKVSAGSR